MHSLNPDSENEPKLIEHSLYYSDKDYKSCMTRANGELRMLNLNIGGLNSKFDKFKLFLVEWNNDTSPLSVITLQETHFTSEIDVNYFQLPGSKFMQNSTVYESMFLEIYNNSCKYRKYIIGSIYRRPSQLVADLTQFIDEFSVTLAKIHATCKQSYIRINSVIIPIIKNKSGDFTDKHNYRPIALSSIISKVFEHTIVNRLEEYLWTNDNQFGFKSGHSTDLCIYALTEFIEYFKSRSTWVYVAFLDASKAFDKISHWTLFKKLIDRHVPLYLVVILC